MSSPIVFISYEMSEYGSELSLILKRRLEEIGMIAYRAEDHPEYTTALADKIIGRIGDALCMVSIIFDKELQPPSVHQEIGCAKTRIPLICMVEKNKKLDELGFVVPSCEVEYFDRDNFNHSIDRVIGFISKIAFEKQPLEISTGSHAGSSQESPKFIKPSKQPSPKSINTPQTDFSNVGINSIHSTQEQHAVCLVRYPPLTDEKCYKNFKMFTDDVDRSLEFGHTWRVDQMSTVIQKRPICITAIVDTHTHFVLTHTITRTKPSINTISTMFLIAQIVADTPDTIESNLPPTHRKAIKKAFDTKWSASPKLPEHRYNKNSLSDVTEYLESSMKRISEHTSGQDLNELKRTIYYEITNYNFIKSLAETDKTPAAMAKFWLAFESLEMIRRYSFSYDKIFIDKLGHLIQFIDIKTINHDKKVIITLKSYIGKSNEKKIIMILQQCGFQKNDKKWILDTPFLGTLFKNSKNKLLPTRSFDVCTKCGNVTRSLQDIFIQNGFRKDGTVRIQPRCKDCRWPRFMTPRIRANLPKNPNKVRNRFQKTMLDFF